MASRRTSIRDARPNRRPTGVRRARAGYTLIEVLIVIGLMVMLISLVLFIDVQSYLGDAFRGERAMVVTALQAARADALNNVGQVPHGVAFHPAEHPHGYVLFYGSSYAGRQQSADRVFEETYPVEFGATSPSQVVFCQLSGDASHGSGDGACEADASGFDGPVTFIDSVRRLEFAIGVTREGAITW